MGGLESPEVMTANASPASWHNFSNELSYLLFLTPVPLWDRFYEILPVDSVEFDLVHWNAAQSLGRAPLW